MWGLLERGWDVDVVGIFLRDYVFDIQCIFMIAYIFFKKSWDKIWKERVAGSTFATANGGRCFFRALPEKNPRGSCTGASFLLTLQSLPFFSGAVLAH